MLVTAVVFALLMAFAIAVASAAGGGSEPSGPSTLSSSLNTNINMGDVGYSMYTVDQTGGNYNLGLTLDISSGVIQQSSISFFKDPDDPLRATVNASIYGQLDIDPTLVNWKSESTNISRRNGFQLSTHAGIGSFQQQIWDNSSGSLVLGDIFSSSNLNAGLSQVTGIDYGYSSYNEQNAYDWTWTDPNGILHTQHQPATFSLNGTWYVDFANAASANMAYSVQPTTVTAEGVPEPSTWTLLISAVCGGLLMLRRRFC